MNVCSIMIHQTYTFHLQMYVLIVSKHKNSLGKVVDFRQMLLSPLPFF